MATPSSVTTTSPGWYPDPDEPRQWRYWDGHAWTDQRSPRSVSESLPGPAGWAAPVASGTSPVPQTRPRTRRTSLVVGVAAIFAVVVFVAVGVANRGSNSPGSTRKSDLVSLLGRDASDPAVDEWGRRCGTHVGSLGNIMCVNSLGFEIDLDTDMRVTRIVLYSIKAADAQYQGSLPGGLSFSDAYTDVVNKLGDPVSLEGGYGAVSVIAHYYLDGYDVSVTYDTWYNRPDYLQDAGILSVGISID
jgi:hypothetical protein